MPFAIDEAKFAKQDTLDMSAPQGTAHGLPVMSIPHMEYPRCIYKHPAEPFRKVLHRNAMREIVQTEMLPTEHLTCAVQNEEELDAKLAEGWVLEPYIPKAPQDPDAKLYQAKK
jgi:hypothetical protein